MFPPQLSACTNGAFCTCSRLTPCPGITLIPRAALKSPSFQPFALKSPSFHPLALKSPSFHPPAQGVSDTALQGRSHPQACPEHTATLQAQRRQACVGTQPYPLSSPRGHLSLPWPPLLPTSASTLPPLPMPSIAENSLLWIGWDSLCVHTYLTRTHARTCSHTHSTSPTGRRCLASPHTLRPSAPPNLPPGPPARPSWHPP